MAAVDTFVWLSTCFGFSGPMILSAAYEAFLDNRILQFLKDSWTMQGGGGPGLTVDMRARLLFTVLVGNLDLHARPFTTNSTTASTIPSAVSPYLRRGSPLLHIEEIIYDLRIYNTSDGSYHPQQWPPIQPTPGADRPPIPLMLVAEHNKRRRRTCIARTKTRLRIMLEYQYSFGSTVGAPVVFFMGAFIYTLIDTLANLGNENTSLSLAFGMWWMIIPHIAILSGLLLAGNNPNTLEGVLALERSEEDTAYYPFEAFGRRLSVKFQLAYDSRYRIQWLWMRGYSKQMWIDTVLDIYGKTTGTPPGYDPSEAPPQPDPQMAVLRSRTQLSISNWITIFSLAGILLVVPFVLAFTTSYYTPTIGLGCRSLTFTVYLITQVLQMALLMIAHKYHETANLVLQGSATLAQTILTILGFVAAAIFGAGAVFTAIGGTMMQLIGVYSECKCQVPLWHWLDLDNPSVWIQVSTNSELDIREARKFWEPCAGTAVSFLGVLCYLGWWYQRRLRDTFRKVVKNLELNARIE